MLRMTKLNGEQFCYTSQLQGAFQTVLFILKALQVVKVFV